MNLIEKQHDSMVITFRLIDLNAKLIKVVTRYYIFEVHIIVPNSNITFI